MKTSERWQRVGTLFDRALATAPPNRLDIVRSSGEPTDVQEEVLALLQSHESSDGFLEPPSILEPGVTIGAYRIERILGRGGMGVVYRAWQPSLGRQVALKCMLRAGDPKAEARFAREIRALGRVEHPNVVKVFMAAST